MANKKFKDKIAESHPRPLAALDIQILQVNVGYLCNMACTHCHADAGPSRREVMGKENIAAVLRVLEETDIATLDITGGAPEMNPHFVYLVEEARRIGRHVMARTNLTIFFEQGMDHLPDFYSENSVEVVASLPCYEGSNVDKVRGKGTFQKCIRAIEKLNSLGYGTPGSAKKLNLVYNPLGAFLAPPQQALEDDYRRELSGKYGLSFDRLYTFSNMPVGRFGTSLARNGNLEQYMERLIAAFSPETLDGLMCRHLINVGWDGSLYDCDFNQMLGLSSAGSRHIAAFDYQELTKRDINTGEHCYGCTAGLGST